MSSYYRSDYHRLKRAEAIVLASLTSGHGNGFAPTTTIVNVLMSVYAWKGDVRRSLDLLDEALYRDIILDVDTFSFALESAGKSTKRALDNRNKSMDDFKRQSIVDENVKAAETILALFEKAVDSERKSLEPNQAFVRNYVAFLCLLEQTETASMVVKDFLEQGKSSGTRLVDNKTLASVAVQSASDGKFDMARTFLASMSESLPFVEERVNMMETEMKEKKLP